MLTSLILTSRLRAAYWPPWCRLIRLDTVRRARPIAEYVDEHDPRRRNRFSNKDGQICSINRYDVGRIRYFMDELEAGRPIDAIRIDTEWSYAHWPYRPLGAYVDDGHHRFMAAVFLRRRRIPAKVDGLVDLKEWLTGERQRWPL